MENAIIRTLLGILAAFAVSGLFSLMKWTQRRFISRRNSGSDSRPDSVRIVRSDTGLPLDTLRRIGVIMLVSTQIGCATIPCSQSDQIRGEIIGLVAELNDPAITVERATRIAEKLQNLSESAQKCGLKWPHESRHSSNSTASLAAQP